jgi:hypothetical protein
MDAIQLMFFSSSEVTVDRLIEALNYYTDKELLDDDDREQMESLKQTQDIIFRIDKDGVRHGALPELLRMKAVSKSDPGYLVKFLSFFTGYTCLPNYKFSILIQFAKYHDSEGGRDGDDISDEALPTAHTCNVGTMTLPATAYNGSKEVLEQKLSKAFKYAHGFGLP